jgi:hypothetical protein
VLAWIKQQQDKQPHHRGDLVGARRSNQKAGLMKDRVDRLAQGTKSRPRPAHLGAAATIATSPQRRPRLPQKLPSDNFNLVQKSGTKIRDVSTTGRKVVAGVRALARIRFFCPRRASIRRSRRCVRVAVGEDFVRAACILEDRDREDMSWWSEGSKNGASRSRNDHFGSIVFTLIILKSTRLVGLSAVNEKISNKSRGTSSAK